MMPFPEHAGRQLDEIADRLVDEWRVFSVDAISQAEVAASVADVVSRVIDANGAGPAVDALDDAPPAPLARRILEILRRHVINSDPALPAEELVPLLRAIERVAEHGEPQWSDRFQDRMAGPSGLDLIVEVAHDLRSPLTSILFLAETMFRGRSGPLTPLQERQLGLVYAAAFGLNAVASDVIELVRGGDRLVRDERQPFSVADVLEAVRDIVLPIAEEKGLTLTCEGPARDRRLGHPSALNRVLLNLTTNALKFTAEGGVAVRIADVSEHAVECSVQDTGRGIPDAAMTTLFEPFRRRQQPGDYAFSGSGLGLSICRKLVEAMGSELNVQTVQGEGTCFAFRLALPRADSEQLLG
ncbi:MAG: HAMP domain-containing histidine kinase [Gemmatimonadales bacterium]|nr:HAMP domain-containing histidine kinase [Gemmatimonadales bacterium]